MSEDRFAGRVVLADQNEATGGGRQPTECAGRDDRHRRPGKHPDCRRYGLLDTPLDLWRWVTEINLGPHQPGTGDFPAAGRAAELVVPSGHRPAPRPPAPCSIACSLKGEEACPR